MYVAICEKGAGIHQNRLDHPWFNEILPQDPSGWILPNGLIGFERLNKDPLVSRFEFLPRSSIIANRRSLFTPRPSTTW